MNILVAEVRSKEIALKLAEDWLQSKYKEFEFGKTHGVSNEG